MKLQNVQPEERGKTLAPPHGTGQGWGPEGSAARSA